MAGTAGGLLEESLIRGVLGGPSGLATLKVTSSSMRPRLQEGDRISVRRVSTRRLAPGDVVVFGTDGAGLVVHRLIWRGLPPGRPSRLITKGDARDRLDPAISPERFLGKVVGIERGSETVRPTTWRDRLRCLVQAAGYGARRGVRLTMRRGRVHGGSLQREIR